VYEHSVTRDRASTVCLDLVNAQHVPEKWKSNTSPATASLVSHFSCFFIFSVVGVFVIPNKLAKCGGKPEPSRQLWFPFPFPGETGEVKERPKKDDPPS
jgi:hypothetical protein